MATLFDRLSGIGLPDSSDVPEDQKIAIHAFTGVLNELRRGKVTGPEIIAMFDLVGTQITHAIMLRDLIIAAPQKTEFMRVFKDFLYLAELELDNSKYSTQALLVSRLQEEVIDQGGTLP